MAEEKYVHCPKCQKRHRWDERLIGRKVKCKGCGKAFVAAEASAPSEARGKDDPVGVPRKATESNVDLKKANRKSTSGYELDMRDFERPAHPTAGSAGTSKCPACNQALPASAIICLKCGFNRTEKKRMKTTLTNPNLPGASRKNAPKNNWISRVLRRKSG